MHTVAVSSTVCMTVSVIYQKDGEDKDEQGKNGFFHLVVFYLGFVSLGDTG